MQPNYNYYGQHQRPCKKPFKTNVTFQVASLMTTRSITSKTSMFTFLNIIKVNFKCPKHEFKQPGTALQCVQSCLPRSVYKTSLVTRHLQDMPPRHIRRLKGITFRKFWLAYAVVELSAINCLPHPYISQNRILVITDINCPINLRRKTPSTLWCHRLLSNIDIISNLTPQWNLFSSFSLVMLKQDSAWFRSPQNLFILKLITTLLIANLFFLIFYDLV